MKKIQLFSNKTFLTYKVQLFYKKSTIILQILLVQKFQFLMQFISEFIIMFFYNTALKVIEAIRACPCLEYLDLEGNTLGTPAAEAIAEILKEKGTPLKKALWKDMFTGRLKTEIPKALEYLGTALCVANSQLTELDLSDNAFGPIGIQGLANLLTSSPCYTLQELRLNNNGLGISGGKMLAKALEKCLENSSKEGEILQNINVLLSYIL